MNKKAIIIGASSGIGKELAIILAHKGYEVGLMARRVELLKSLQQQLPGNTYTGYIDVKNPTQAVANLHDMIQQMDGADLIVINAGVGYINPDLDWKMEKETIEVNVNGFCCLAGEAFRYFSKQKKGHIVGISSIAALRGNDAAPAYNASKAFMSNYMQGLRRKAAREGLPITITDIMPGFVDTDMAKGEGKFWVASPSKAAKQIYTAIQMKRRQAYITRRWRLVAWLLKLMPDFIYNRT